MFKKKIQIVYIQRILLILDSKNAQFFDIIKLKKENPGTSAVVLFLAFGIHFFNVAKMPLKTSTTSPFMFLATYLNHVHRNLESFFILFFPNSGY